MALPAAVPPTAVNLRASAVELDAVTLRTYAADLSAVNLGRYAAESTAVCILAAPALAVRHPRLAATADAAMESAATATLAVQHQKPAAETPAVRHPRLAATADAAMECAVTERAMHPRALCHPLTGCHRRYGKQYGGLQHFAMVVVSVV